jgi:uncharacterized protein (DUF1501 family)
MFSLRGTSNSRREFCDGISRRDVLRIGTLAGLASVGGMTLPQLLAAESRAGVRTPKSVIMIYLVGGPPHQRPAFPGLTSAKHYRSWRD